MELQVSTQVQSQVQHQVRLVQHLTATGNVAGGNLTTAGQVAADNADITNGITAGTTITATGNVAGGNITTGGAVEATGLISSGSTITATGNVAGGNVTTAGQVQGDNFDATNGITAGTTVTATGNVAGGNITTGGAVDATGAVTGASVTAGNVTVNTDSIDSAGTAITLNTDSSDVDIIIENAAGNAYVKADAGASSVTIGENATATTDATLKVGGDKSMMIPVGATSDRPGTPVTGMIRFNTTLDSFEFYDSNSWTTAGSDFTVIASETFSGDNSTVAFTLSSTQTTASCIVSINGVVQIPVTAYGVSGTTLTFTEAPLAGDAIEVREITTTSTITEIASADTSSIIDAQDGGDVNIKGNIIPSANATYDIGSSSERYNELFLSGSSITLGNVVIKNTGGNAVGFFGPDGTTPGTIDANVEIAGDSIQNGTSLVDFAGVNGNVNITAGGVASMIATTDGANVTGNLTATGNVAATYFLGDGSQLTGIDATAITNGTSDVSVAANADITVTRGGTLSATFTATGITATTFTGESTSAQYADLAEMYAADEAIEPGTVVMFGGEGKVEACDAANCRAVAGIISTDPAHLMNSTQEGVALALAGRVPCKVTGPVAAGDLMVSAGNGMAMANNDAATGTVIGKAIEANESGDGVIEVLALMM